MADEIKSPTGERFDTGDRWFRHGPNRFALASRVRPEPVWTRLLARSSDGQGGIPRPSRPPGRLGRWFEIDMKPILLSMKLRGNATALAFVRFRKGIFKMSTIQTAVVFVGAAAGVGFLLVILAPEFAPDLALVTVTIFG